MESFKVSPQVGFSSQSRVTLVATEALLGTLLPELGLGSPDLHLPPGLLVDPVTRKTVRPKVASKHEALATVAANPALLLRARCVDDAAVLGERLAGAGLKKL